MIEKNENKINKIVINSKEAMADLGAKISKILEKGDVLLLIGDLGSGKTTFVKGIVGTAFSPSFTLLNKYDFKGTRIYHLDFYRLEKPDFDLFMELEEVEDEIIIVEWPKFDLPIFKNATVLEFVLKDGYREIFVRGEKASEYCSLFNKS
jgi:tRNA threonylcarbamoyladenosine biosynthesis protein TsaE